MSAEGLVTNGTFILNPLPKAQRLPQKRERIRTARSQEGPEQSNVSWTVTGTLQS